MAPMQNDYANYVTRTLLKAITTIEPPKASSSSNSKSKTPAKKTPSKLKQKDSSSSKKKGPVAKADNKIEYSSSEDEPLRPSSQKDFANSGSGKVAKNLSGDSDKEQPIKKSGKMPHQKIL